MTTTNPYEAMSQRRLQHKQQQRQRNVRLFKVFVFLLLGLFGVLGISIGALLNETQPLPTPVAASTVR
jgi:hypothetical protein